MKKINKSWVLKDKNTFQSGVFTDVFHQKVCQGSREEKKLNHMPLVKIPTQLVWPTLPDKKSSPLYDIDLTRTAYWMIQHEQDIYSVFAFSSKTAKIGETSCWSFLLNNSFPFTQLNKIILFTQNSDHQWKTYGWKNSTSCKGLSTLNNPWGQTLVKSQVPKDCPPVCC